jgi:HSP20 family protein
MNIVRWRPMRDIMNLRSEFDRLFEEAFDMAPTRWQTATNWGLDLDVAEDQDKYTVKASVPGMNPDDIEITLANNVLTIRGETKSEETKDEEQYHLRERRYGSFARSVTLPVTVNAEVVEAACENGVLTIEIPKAEETKPKRISVRSDSGQNMIEGESVAVNR